MESQPGLCRADNRADGYISRVNNLTTITGPYLTTREDEESRLKYGKTIYEKVTGKHVELTQERDKRKATREAYICNWTTTG